jgi:hypothetical protein
MELIIQEIIQKIISSYEKELKKLIRERSDMEITGFAGHVEKLYN